ncbi:CHAT domain-containing protein [Nostoc sp. ATCC 53789]|uniref:CHAT domain-containing protein n=1 Tax=Nostoc sp. ATCC 53789 TaxID=76335 RepID=UPI001ADCE9CA|nr:CHAT domain-containing protein [Nostoc sp. ATCC 53789]
MEQVLQEIQKIGESIGDAEKVDRLLQENLEHLYEKLDDKNENLDDKLVRELRTWATKMQEILDKLQPEEAKKIAKNILIFSNKIFQFSLNSKASNTEKEIVIAGYEIALKVFDKEAYPQEWALLQDQLGCFYSSRIRGGIAENIELAIQAFNSALKVYTHDYLCEQWANTQNNLGNTYLYRRREDKAENLETAIKLHNNVLKKLYNNEPYSIIWSNSYSLIWAETKNYIGCAYLEREKEDKAKNIELAIEAFKDALRVYTCNSFTYEWAKTHNNIGNAYLQRKKGDENLTQAIEESIEAFNAASQVFIDLDNYQWARTQNNLSSAYLQKKKGNKQENIDLAIKACQAALKVYNHNAYPQEWAITQSDLGDAYQTAGKYSEAYEAFDAAIGIVENLRGKIIFGSNIDSDKQKLAEEANLIYQNMVELCLELANNNPQYYAHAIEYAERSQARNLVELLATKNLYPKGDIYREEIDKLRHEISSKQRQNLSQQELPKLQKGLDELLNKINIEDDSFKFTQKINPISYSEIQDLVEEKTAIIKWYITTNKIITFIITGDKNHKSQQKPLCICSSKGLEKLIKWCKEYFETYHASRNDDNKRHEWKSLLTTRIQKLAKILHIRYVLSLIPENCNRLILIPHRFLHSLPLHALPFSNKQDKCLLDKFPGGVSYAPSCQLLQLSQTQQSLNLHHLFAIQNPSAKNPEANLKYSNLEVKLIKSFFGSYKVLEEQEAKEDNFKKFDWNSLSNFCIHFACHGEFNLKYPLESALILAETEEEAKDKQLKEQKEDGRLTLAEIFGLNLKHCQLVTLSACETGIADFQSLSDEYICLPSGFLFAGSPNVVASLWKVKDISTAFLTIKFYENLKQMQKNSSQLEKGAVAIALNQAQLWLRDLTVEKLNNWMKNMPLTGTEKFELRNTFPFDQIREPHHWAAFCAIGQ